MISPIYLQLINWFKPIHNIDSENQPSNEATSYQLEQLTQQLSSSRKCVWSHSNNLRIHFREANKTHSNNSREGTAVDLDQLASHELNT